MKKIFLILCSILFCMSATAFAELHESQVANVESISSAFNYQDPELLKIYTQKKLAQEQEEQQDNSSDENQNEEQLVEPPKIFSVYVNYDRFYNKDNHDKYTERIDIGFTSHNLERNFIFDKKRPPYLVIDNGITTETLKFKKFKFDNPYWISFALTKDDIAKINYAKEITIVLPESEDNIYKINKRTQNIEKKSYNKKMTVIEQSFTLPAHILAEWKEVLSKA